MNIVFKTIKTLGGYYVYDRNRHAILVVDELEYGELEAIAKKEILPEDSKVVAKYQKEGYLAENRLKKIESSYTNILEHHLKHHIEQVTLQVTQRCNLRCEYCIYSGNYDNRVHCNYDMDMKTAVKAIDLYINSSEEIDVLTIGFYGGEPLLQIDLIKKCVDYVKEKAIGKQLNFIMTTNGTLLTNDIAKYLNDNNFTVTISLDGLKSEHDRYRKFANGKGSFDVIMKNLDEIRTNVPDFYKRISFNTVINPRHDYQKMKNYFEHSRVTSDAKVMFSLVESTELGKEVDFSEEFNLIRTFDYFKLLLNMLGKLDEQYISKLVLSQKAAINFRYNEIIKKVPINEKEHHGGPCVPGAKRMFVNAHGNIYPCERVSETSEVMKIGHIDKGFDIEKASNLLNVGKVTEDLCLKCWALLSCNICAQKADGNDHLSKKVKCLSCPQSKNNALIDLKELCVLKELGCSFEL